MRRSIVPTLVAAVGAAVLSATPAFAGANTCIAGKLACTSAFTSAVFKCYAKIFKTGFGGDNQEKAVACVRKARSKFGTALSNKVQCWDKVEAKEKAEKPETICPVNVFDEYDVDDLVEDFTLDTVKKEVAPSGPSSLGNSCSAGKVACVGNFFKQIFKCEINAHKAGVAADEACIAKAYAKFNGGTDPSKSCFAKLEAKQKLGKPKTYCDAIDNLETARGNAELFVAIVVVGLEP